jgi:predicted peptidase
MGGFGTFAVAEEYPDLFAAIAPLAGGGETNRPERLKSIPVRAFHGDEDKVVSYDHSVKMIEAIKAVGNCDAQLTTVPRGKHQICPDVYGNPEIYRWFLEHGK